jgi:hypothetical protein
LSRYRKIETRLFGDAGFRKLSKPQPCGQYLLLWFLAGPATCIIPGVIFNFGPAGLSEMLGWPLEGFNKAFKEVSDQGFAEADFDAPLIFIPSAVAFNLPQSPNVVTGWGRTFTEIPDCELKAVVWQTLKSAIEGMAKAFQKAFVESCREPLLNQEQEAGAEHRSRKRALALRASATTSVAASLVDQDEDDDEVPEWPERPLNEEERQQQLIAEDGDGEDVPY